MQRPKCAIKNCENEGFIGYANKWICGRCYMKIINKKQEEQTKDIEELEI